RDRLAPVAGDTALPEAELMLQHVLHCTRSDLYLSQARKASQRENACIEAIIQRRCSGEPLPYVLGVAHFHSLELVINHDVLIPRPETETLVETVLAHEPAEQCRFVDMGTGSGAISAALAQSRPQWHGIAIDCSIAALHIAQRNCLKARVSLLCCDMISAFKNLSGVMTSVPIRSTIGSESEIHDISKRGFDFVVSNPPYVSDNEMLKLDDSVRLFEPLVALGGGMDGLDFYELLSSQAKNILVPGGRLYCEIGASQEEKISRLLAGYGWNAISFFPDLTGRARVVMATVSKGQTAGPQN
ncbi:MAG TPA: peptide chain release factor N(5)-glutamine methyltransferase, partial [Chitinivibrionales bacterium]|nr:peptide chain release factor N(5)-glutamine methyltransferase [Chitinivibrionales bacterium]